jgi:oxygen-dependent protoporphyrinogen oxidase
VPEASAGVDPAEVDRGVDRRVNRADVVVVGAGITGLAAALALASPSKPGAGRPAGPPPQVIVLEASDQLGGKLRTEPFAGVDLDTGPDAFLARVPYARALCESLGIADQLVAPATGRAWLWTRGHLRPLPPGLVLGVPSDLAAVASSGIIGPLGLLRAGLDLVLPRRHGTVTATTDRSVGDIVIERFGHQVHERLVDPLLGGIHAGRSEELSAAATAPQLAEAAQRGRSLLRSLRTAAPGSAAKGPEGKASAEPVFLAHRGGMGRIVDALRAALSADGVEIRLRSPATGLTATADGWRLDTPGGPVHTRAVVLACPARGAAALLDNVAPAVAFELAGIEHASVVLTSLAYRPSALPGPLDGSGFLVPRVDGRLLTAATWTSSKWPHLAPRDLVLIRASAGRSGDDRALVTDDESLVRRVHDELVEAMGLREPPVHNRVVRWVDGFPQYRVGHLDRVGRIEAGVEALGGIAIAGAAYRGVGIPACIASGQAAAARVLTQWASVGGSEP